MCGGVESCWELLVKWLAALFLGIPVLVLRAVPWAPGIAVRCGESTL